MEEKKSEFMMSSVLRSKENATGKNLSGRTSRIFPKSNFGPVETKAENDENQLGVEELKAELKKVIAELEKTMAKLEKTKAELKETKTELKETRAGLEDAKAELEELRTLADKDGE